MTDQTYLFREISRNVLEAKGIAAPLEPDIPRAPDRFIQECLKIVSVPFSA